MPEYLTYILKANACLIGFYAFYGLFLRRSTFFVFNRVYLLAGLALSFVIPLLRISVPAAVPWFDWTLAAEVHAPETAAAAVPLSGPEFVPAAPFPIWKLLAGIYLTGCFLFLVRFISSFFRIARLKRSAEPLGSGRWRVRRTEGTAAFSFFRTIFLPRSGSGPLVLEHEKVHVRQGHTVDLLFMETAVLLLWFNPFVFLYRRTLKLNHEYLADDRIVRREGGVENYLECILEQIGAGHPEHLVHAFGSRSLKKRIHMMTKNKTPRRYAWTYLLALPLLAALTLAFASYAQTPVLEPFAQQSAVIVTQNTAPDEYTPSIFPVDKSRIRSTGQYGTVRNGSSLHTGVDYAASVGTEVFATASGEVTESSHDGNRGNYVIIRHSPEHSTFYSHLEKSTVKPGDRVRKGEIIGTVGNTGRSTGNHLHYEVRKYGNHVDPTGYLPE